MNVMEKARRSDALHYDWISRRNLCDMIANLESDLEDVRKENAKLRELLAYSKLEVKTDGMEAQMQPRMAEEEAGLPDCQ